MGQEHNENLFPIHTPSILHGALVAVSWVWPSCTKCRLRAIWAWSMVISIKYHQLWPRKRPCGLIKVGTSKGHWPQFHRFLNCKIVLKVFLSPMDYGPLFPIFLLQDCTKSLPFSFGLWISLFTDFSFVRLYKKSSFQLWIMDLFFTDFSFVRLYWNSSFHPCAPYMGPFYRFFFCKIVQKVFLSALDYGPLFTDFSFARLYWSLPFTHVLHIWDHLNCKNPAAKEHHLPCH
jgi:hypothetical protein